jgi:polyisoprenoid-binding protein YceI
MRVALLVCAALFVGRASAQPAGLQVDADKSSVVAVVHKSGLFSALAHEHGVVAMAWSAQSCFDEANPAASRVSVTVPTASLRIDTPDARRLAKLPASGPGAKDVAEIQAKMLGPDVLDAARYPEIRFATTAVRQTARDTLALDGTFSLHGKERPASFNLKMDSSPDGWRHFSGAFTMKQTDYGIKPISISGLVNVKDAVDIRIEMYAKPGSGACP